MCGIAGIYAYHSAADSIDRVELIRMRDHMASRGPDGKGEWYSADGRVGFGHRRLSVIDLSSRSAQPMQTADGRLVINFNGEIYNYRALRRKLEAKGYVFRTDSDTEVLLYLYADLGHEMLHELRGMFAFSIWDTQEQQLLLARDPYGIKPLYYVDDGSTLRFASQVKALTAGRGVSSEPDPAGWVGFYLFGSVPEPFTTYRKVHAVPVGSFMRIGQRGPDPCVQYYSISKTYVEAQEQPLSLSMKEEVIAIVREAVLDSVRHHLVADVPVGAFLSGGIDSGALVGLMREAGQQDIQTVTLAFDEFRGTADDEAPDAAAVANFYATQHTTRVVGEKEFRSDLPTIIEAMDQPTIDGINTWFVSKAASELGLKVAISGLGGDELFGGYSSFRSIPTWVRWMAGLSSIPSLGQVLRRAFRKMHCERLGLSPKAAGLVELGGTYWGAYLLRRGIFMPWELSEVLDPDLARDGLKRLDPFKHIARALAPDPVQSFARVATLETSLYMRNQLLRDTDWTSMAHALEVRVPLVDAELLRRIAPVTCGGYARFGKELLASTLPRELADRHKTRSKTGFSTPIATWLKNGAASAKPDRRVLMSHWSRRWLCSVAGQFELNTLSTQKAAKTFDASQFARIDGDPKRVLVSTLKMPTVGGVVTMLHAVIGWLVQRGYQPIIAYYEPYSLSPQLSVPAFAMLRRSPGLRIDRAYGCESYAIGAWLPELEFTHYVATKHWKSLIESCSAHLSVSGNVLAATPYYQTETPFLAWVATGWHDDRKNRVYPLARKLIDRAIITPNVKRLERSILQSGKIIALSQYTKRILEEIAGEPIVSSVLSMPVDATFWTPRPESRVAGRVGFCGRLSDPRKNVDLLLAAMARASVSMIEISAVLIGGEADSKMRALLAQHGIADRVRFIPHACGAELRDHLRSFDLFVLPSHQEGLCIAALEAMACGCPVVSTRCGGPEEFVIDGDTGTLVGFDPNEMAAAMLKVLSDRQLHARLAHGARNRILQQYSMSGAESVFWHAFNECFPDLARRRVPEPAAISFQAESLSV
jgi:asparagine synthase (glutamine-hydrolysing)